MYELAQSQTSAQTPRHITLGRFASYLAENWTLALLALPGVIYFLLFNYLPMFGIVVAFEDYNVKTGFLSPWVGLRNFRVLWESPVLWRIVSNTVVLNLLFITATTMCALTVALLLNEVRSKFFKSTAQLFMFLPFFMGWALVAMLLYGLTDYNVGSLNRFLVSIGMQKLNLEANPAAWPWILTLIRVWKFTGSDCIVYLAALVGIDPQLYESAAIDGAGRWARIRHISLPALLPTVITLTLLAIGRIFHSDYGMLYALVGQKPMLYATTDVIDTYILRALRTNVSFGMSTAVGLTQSLLGFIFVLGSNLLVKRWSQRQGEAYGLF